MKLCLNMIVKNEAGRITRALKSAVQFIDSYVITDTGSDDHTDRVIRQFFADHQIPGLISYAPFKDWSQARNHALITARSVQPRFGWDYALLMDADMELVVKDLPKFHKSLETGGLSYDMEQRAGTLHYGNRRLVSAKATGLYKGVTHEYLDVHSAGLIPPETAHFIDHADGANRPEKYKRDIRLLLEGLEKEPNNERYFYYLAQSYRDAGDTELAKHWYRRRVAAGGWAEEQWSAQVNLACCYKDEKDEDGFIREMLIAYNMRPSRAEPLYDLAHYFRCQDGKQNIAALFAEIGMSIPRTNDLLFVNDFVYAAGLKEEFAITGFYNEQKRPKAFQVCSDLSLTPGDYPSARHSARHNIYWYTPTLKDVCPSFHWQRLPFEPPENWVAMNPSVTLYKDQLMCNVRCVNYRIDNEGRYLIRANDGTCNDSNPIETRNFLITLDHHNLHRPPIWGTELLPPGNMPCEFKPVIGLEDSRLFSADGALWTSSTVRQIHWDGNCEQVLALVDMLDTPKYGPWQRMLPEPRVTEKNWAPIGLRADDHRELLFMHRPGVVINNRGKVVYNNPAPLTGDIVSGGSQLVDAGDFYLALVHTAHQLPNSPCRWYYHRWAMYDQQTFKLVKLSLPFVFNEKVIEFAAGLARHPTEKDTLVISYGFKDNEARIATVSQSEVMRFLWQLKL